MSVAELLLACALSLPSPQFHHGIVSYRAVKIEADNYRERMEQQDLTDFIRRYSPGAEVIVDPQPRPDVMRRNGWEPTPWKWRDKPVWIRRQPVDDRGRGNGNGGRKREALGESA